MENVQSPCILVCVIEPESGYCYGCGRSRDEIARWSDMDRQEQRMLVNALPERLSGIERPPRRKTRRRQMAEQREAGK